MENRVMNYIPQQYANGPNLWRVAQELAKSKDPYKAAGMLVAILKGAQA